MMASTPVAGGRIFISYQRDDTANLAGRLFDRLADHFDRDRIFAGIDSIEPGADFAEVIASAMTSGDVLVVLIGGSWLTARDEFGRRRLDDSDNLVRLEIEAALTLNVPVIPVLVDLARMPRAEELPASLAKLASLQAIELRPSFFESDTAVLLRALNEVLALAAAPVTEAPAERETRIQASQLERPKIFLCYRREDTQGFARGIYERLVGEYGHEQVFRDIDSTPAGVRFSTWIESRVSQCSVMIVLIGHVWSSAKNPRGQRRLDLPKDWVRQEIEAALTRDIPIIPVRVQGTPMPSEDELPASIADLTGFQAAEVTDSRWDYDIGLLIQAIDNLIALA